MIVSISEKWLLPRKSLDQTPVDSLIVKHIE